MRAEELAGLLVEDRLGKPLRFAKRDRLTVADEGDLADANLVAGFLCPLFRQANRGDLRAAIGAAGDLQLVDRVWLQPGDRLDADDPLMLGLVGEERRSGDIADRVNAGHIGAAVAVDNDGAALDLHAELVEPEILD